MLKDHVALVTGSTSGIGLGIAEQLASAGAHVTLNGFADEALVSELKSRLGALAGSRIDYDGADMRDPAAVRAMVAKVAATHGRIDILVNNAGIQHVAPVEDFPIDKCNDIIAINLSSAFHASAAAIPAMKAARSGRIIMMASAHALAASPFKAAYVAAKHGIAGLTKTIALELAEFGITCNAICPGYVLTPLVERQIPIPPRRAALPRRRSNAMYCWPPSQPRILSPSPRLRVWRCICVVRRQPRSPAPLCRWTAVGPPNRHGSPWCALPCDGAAAADGCAEACPARSKRDLRPSFRPLPT